MKICILMLGRTPRREKEAIIQKSVYEQSGLVASVELIDTDDKLLEHGSVGTTPSSLQKITAAVKRNVQVIILNGDNLTDSFADHYIDFLDNKYKIVYRATDDGTYCIPDGREMKRV